jgi:ribose transport system ATP-binding protein
MTIAPDHPSKPALLQVEGVSKWFGTTQALNGATLTLQAGEIHVLLGENGAGKSTLAKIIAGVHRLDAGTMQLNGKPIHSRTVQAARHLGIAMVFQELSLAPDLTVLDNLFLGQEGSHPLAWLRRSQERQRCQAVFETLALDLPLEAPVRSLTIAQKQLLEIAKALVQQPRLVIMDEPTATLTDREKRFLFQTLQTLKQRGVSILYVTHHLREVLEIGTRVSAMLDGAVKTTAAVTPALTESVLLEMLTGRQLSMVVARASYAADQPLLTVENLATKTCQNIHLQIAPGEIAGIYGIVGCGRESVGRTIAGLAKPLHGTMTLAGQHYAPRHPGAALAQGVGFLPADRKEAGILAERSICENLNLSNLEAFAKRGLLSTAQERLHTTQQLEQLQVRYTSIEEPITHLSGGNQQKILFGRAIVRASRLLVMEDPTAGIDMGTRLELYRQMKDLADRGASFLLLSSDLVETLLLCNRVYSMYEGAIVDEVINPTLNDEERVLANVLGKSMKE